MADLTGLSLGDGAVSMSCYRAAETYSILNVSEHDVGKIAIHGQGSAMSEREGFAKISLAAVRALSHEKGADFEVYLPGADGQTPVLYHKSDGDVAGPDFHRMAEHGATSLFVRLEDLTECERAIEARLADILNNPRVAPADKAVVVQGAGTTIARDIINESVSSQGLERASVALDSMIGCVLNDPVVAAYLLEMAGHERSTASHMFVVSTLSVMLGARAFGTDPETLKALAFAGMLHDVGKLSLDADLLNKPSPLSREEIQLVQQHPIESVRLLGDDPHVSQAARQMILQHHERVDGRGYPVGVSGADLLPGSRVIAITDSFHAMIGQRSYRAPLTPPEANRVLSTQADRQFDADLLVRWQEVFDEYWSTLSRKDRPEFVPEADELSSRHEHRPTPPVPKMIHQRPTRHACDGRTMVQCKYAGRLIDVSTAPAEFGALVHDVSRSGVCIYAAHPMYRGEVVHVQVGTSGTAAWLRSTVAWCRQTNPSSYRIGLRFTQRLSEAQVDEPADVIPMAETSGISRPTGGSGASGCKGPSKSAKTAPVGRKREHDLGILAGISAMRRPNAESQRTAVTLAMSGDVKVRLKALDVLMNIGTKMAREALVSLLGDSNQEVRERAVVATGVARATEAIGKLHDILRDPNDTIALRAAGALGRLGDTSGLGLVEMMLDPDCAHARLAAQMLGEITGHRFAANLEGIKAARRYLDAKKSLLGSR